MKKRIIELFDTTLRDGTQGEGVNLSVEDKLRIAKKLDDFGINIIEGGWPGSNPRDKDFFKRAKLLKLSQAEMCAFGSTARKPNAVEKDLNLKALLEAETSIITIFGKTWQLHSKQGMGISNSDNALLIERSVSYLVDRGRRVIFDAEHFFDGYSDSKSFAVDMLKAAVNGGADTLVLCDTNGGSLPEYVGKTTKMMVQKFSQPIGIHCHNDSGLAVANTITAVTSGATHVQGTINGMGERCGNVSLATVIPNLILKLECQTKSKIELENLYRLVQFVYDIMNLHPDD
ncbi:MAG: citramalate synthase, partial [Candidatus Neomarinimicrobiota bacterium]